MGNVMGKKALQAVACYDDLLEKLDLKVDTPVIFNLSDGRKKQIEKSVYGHNPFPGLLKLVLLSLRKKAVKRLYEDEKVLQTGPAAAILALDSVLVQEIGNIRNNIKESQPVMCDVDLAGLQVVRLYMSAYQGNKDFIKARCDSAVRVDNALNGSFYKYKTKDGRKFSAHVYYESQKKIMMETLGITKEPGKFVLSSLPFDKVTTAKAVKQWNAQELEEKTFENGACGCMLRTRQEWEESEVGKAVCEMPLFRLTKENADLKKKLGKYDKSRGPLSGIKVLDLTHIIAGPACTRLLAEAGADVLMVRRGKYVEQEQAMLELDGWAGKRSIQLDFNNPKQLEKAKKLVKEADIVVCSYQVGALDKFGLSEKDIHKLNPNVIYGSLRCFSDTVWNERPGWAPCAEDITGLSVRNGSLKKPVNLNGVPLDYIPGMILCAGILKALKLQLTEGGSYTVTGSLTRGGYWLHECTDLWEKLDGRVTFDTTRSSIVHNSKLSLWNDTFTKVPDTAVGDVYFTTPATNIGKEDNTYRSENMYFNDGKIGFRKKS
ncbi:CoA-transferase family III [Butyrivibrio sp. Su6]|uniref:CoA transferase n=1 Tax=Butyrivibrio sp. Su6 TaxID=1520810 RepID=UPI00089E25D6|nr:CoA transferase [Butyrivibrio sp. Su6]SEG48398.1 CoA-transferase family III [Butyrivibrio sp. Su6]